MITPAAPGSSLVLRPRRRDRDQGWLLAALIAAACIAAGIYSRELPPVAVAVCVVAAAALATAVVGERAVVVIAQDRASQRFIRTRHVAAADVASVSVGPGKNMGAGQRPLTIVLLLRDGTRFMLTVFQKPDTPTNQLSMIELADQIADVLQVELISPPPAQPETTNWWRVAHAYSVLGAVLPCAAEPERVLHWLIASTVVLVPPVAHRLIRTARGI